jgi:putative SOS response-associated peptidase YedK
MCYSAQVVQSFSKLRRRFNAQVDFDQIERTFRQRIQYGPRAFQISRAVEFNFDHPESDAEERIKKLIDEYRTSRGAEIETELFEQKTRLTKADRAIADAEAAGKAPTKKALNDKRVATNKVESLTRWKTDLWRTEPMERDSRIFANHFVPIIVKRKSVNVIQLGRYLLRRQGTPPSFDARYQGVLYNSRRDNLTKFWAPEFGKTHALFYVSSFFENVERDGENAVAHFKPDGGREMIIACLYSDWGDPQEDGFLSFSAITDEPPAEVQAAGHDRIIINLDESAIEDWLAPQERSNEELQALLDNRSRPRYNHEILAAAA